MKLPERFTDVARLADVMTAPAPELVADPRTLEMKTHEKFGDYTRRIHKLLGMQ